MADFPVDAPIDVPVSPAVPFEQTTVPLVIGPQVPPVDQEEMRRRALVFHNALGQRSPGVDVLSNRLRLGQESDLRRELAVSEQRELYHRRQEFLRSYIQNRPAEAGQPSQRELDYIQRLSSGELAQAETGDPRVYIERKLAEQSTEAVSAVRQGVPEPIAEQIDQAVQTEQMLAQYAQARLQDLLSEAKRRGDVDTPYLGRNALDIALTMASPVFWYRMQNAMGPGTGGGNFWSGSNISDQASWYYSQRDISAGTTALDRAIEAIRNRTGTAPEGNLQAAIQYLSLIVSNSSFDYFLQNIQSYVDVAPFVGWVPYGLAGRLAYSTGRRAYDAATAAQTARYANAAAQAARASVVNPPEIAPAAVAEAAGNLNLAADHTARNALQELAQQTHGTDALTSFTRYARSMFSPETVISEAGTRLSNEQAQRVFTAMSTNAEALVDNLFVRPTQISRLPDGTRPLMQAEDEAWRIAVNHQYHFPADRVLDARITYPTNVSSLPKRLQQPATDALTLERQISNSKLVPEFEAYKAALETIEDIRKILRPFTNRFDRLPKVVRDRAQAAGVDISSYMDDLKAVRQAIAAIPAANKKLFDDTLKAVKRYDQAASTVSAKMRRPTGFDAHVSVMDSLPLVRGLGNVPHIVIPIGDHGAKLFDSIERAVGSAMRELHLRPDTYKILPQGTGYYIAVMKPLDETAGSVRRALEIETTKYDPTPRPLLPIDLIQRFLPLGGSTRVSAKTSADLKAATYSSNNTYDQVAKIVRKTLVQPLKAGGKESEAAFNKFIEWQRVFRNPDGPPGIFSRNQMDFETQWNLVTGRYPTENESLAYWTYVQINDIDKLLRDVSIYRDKARVGLELHDLRLLNSNQVIGSGGIEGKVVVFDDNLWKIASAERAGVLVWDPDINKMGHIYVNARGGRKSIEDLIGQGYRTIQITHFAEKDLHANPLTLQALERLRDTYPKHQHLPAVDFILARDLRSSPIPLQQTPNRPGGHHQYAFTKLIRQPDIRNGKYYGDNTLRGFERGPDAEYYLPRYEQARKLMNDIDRSGGRILETVLEDYLKKNLPEDPKSFRRLFTTGPYNRDIPFMISNDGENLWRGAKLVDKYPGLQNALESPLNLYNTTTLRFMMERGETPLTVARRGTTENPTHHLAPATRVDAAVTMDRAIAHAVRNSTISDVQIKSAERFIAEFHDVLSPSLDQLRRDPLDALLNPVWRPGADPYLLQTAKNYQRVFVESLGLQRPELRNWNAIQNKLADEIYKIGGERFMIENPSLIKTIRHPIQALRNATAYYYLMTPWQFMVQAAGALNIIPHAGIKIASESLAASIYGRIVRDFTGVKPEALLEEIFPKLKEWGWSKQDFIEAYRLGTDTGFFRVGREHSMIDDLTQPSVARGRFGAVLDMGMGFFRKGEESMRHMAFWAAYRMWKQKFPNVPIDDMAKIQILDQADRMSGNMSSVGMSSLQRSGLTSLGTTFWGYNLRIFEQLWGLDQHKLSYAQRSKIALKWLLVNSIIFGPPAALATATFLPMTSIFNRMLISHREQNPNGAVADNPLLFDLISQGVLGQILPGTNVSERLSPGGSRFFSEFLGDKAAYEILGGASWSAIRDVALSTQPYFVFIMDSFTPADKQVGARITQADLERSIANLGGRGASALMRSYWALSLHQIMNNQRMNLTDIIQSEALVFALTGLQPDRVTDTFDILKNEESLRNHQRYHEKFIVQAWRDMTQASLDGRLDDAFKYAQDMRVYISLGRYRPDQIQALISRVARDRGSVVENVLRRYSQQGEAQRNFYLQYLKRLEQ